MPEDGYGELGRNEALELIRSRGRHRIRRRRTIAGSSVLLVAALLAVVSLPGDRTTVRVGGSATGQGIIQPPASAYASGEPAAEALASHLLDAVVLPAGSTPFTGGPPPPLDHAYSYSSAAVNQSRLWQVPAAPTATMQYLSSHLPGVSGAVLAGPNGPQYNPDYSPTVEFSGELHSLPSGISDAWVTGDDAAYGGGTLLRVDITIDWIPARPAGLAVPSQDRAVVATVGGESPTSTTATITVSDPATVDNLANLFNSLPPQTSGRQPDLCALPRVSTPTTTVYTLAFGPAASGQPDLIVSVSCPTVSASIPGAPVARPGGPRPPQFEDTSTFDAAVTGLFPGVKPAFSAPSPSPSPAASPLTPLTGEKVPPSDHVAQVTGPPPADPSKGLGLPEVAVTDTAAVARLAALFNGLPVAGPAPAVCTFSPVPAYIVSFVSVPTGGPDTSADFFAIKEPCNRWAVTIRGRPAESLEDSPALDAALGNLFGG